MRIGSSGGQGDANLPVIEHTIREGETIESIAKQYGVSQDALLVANPILNTGIAVGQVLQIPNAPPPQEKVPEADKIETANPNLFEQVTNEPIVPQALIRAATPYVPARMLKEAMEEPADAGAAGEVTELTLTPEELQINDQGQLVISNPELIEYFKTLIEKVPEQSTSNDVRLQILRKKLPEGSE